MSDLQICDLDVFDQNINNNEIMIYYSAWASVLCGFQQCVREMKELGYSDNLEIVNLDSHASIFDLPNNDIIVLNGFNSSIDEKNVSFGWFIGVSTFNDINNHRLAKIISYLYARFNPGKSIKVFDDEGNETSKLILTNDTHIVPMSKEKNRSMQMISVEAMSTSTIA